MKFLDKFSVQKQYDILDEWNFIGIASDIYEMKSQRKEYQHLVSEAEDIGLFDTEIIAYVLKKLEYELTLPWYKRPTTWHLVKLFFKL